MAARDACSRVCVRGDGESDFALRFDRIERG
jgi:hypothetical protein